jgi:hypothetical protein
MKKTYEIELRRTSYIALTIEAENEDDAKALAWQQSMPYHSTYDSQWDIESIEEVTNQGESE